MATSAPLTTDIETELEMFAHAIADLYRLQEDWDGDPNDPWHYSEMLAWRRNLTRLERYLDGPYRTGQMTPEQVARYRALLVRLKEALPIIERLGFPKPTISLEP
ncbi:hypothetical protein NET02_15215 [Thermomicrobiaceae bacterium CFH 74404]|uniref:Uncharacterized protein n=1 Tax=Thermalbibacter longus TaxID=2951981 RepID=A0AA42BB43_9BACT|nr:hypothetical protein [Thermalbibacter longus]MCM8750497.1 hypothetical protein [Thermalbibacter longus]